MLTLNSILNKSKEEIYKLLTKKASVSGFYLNEGMPNNNFDELYNKKLSKFLNDDDFLKSIKLYKILLDKNENFLNNKKEEVYKYLLLPKYSYENVFEYVDKKIKTCPEIATLLVRYIETCSLDQKNLLLSSYIRKYQDKINTYPSVVNILKEKELKLSDSLLSFYEKKFEKLINIIVEYDIKLDLNNLNKKQADFFLFFSNSIITFNHYFDENQKIELLSQINITSQVNFNNNNFSISKLNDCLLINICKLIILLSIV
jgi:hypothetical protein